MAIARALVNRPSLLLCDEPTGNLDSRNAATLKRLDPAAATRAVERLREALAAHMSDDGVWFSSRAWIITARPH